MIRKCLNALGTTALALAVGTAGAWAQSITIAIGSEPSTLDPQLRDDGGERQVNDNIYETLMARKADGALIPGLAAAAPERVSESAWEFVLREGIEFHNGEPFNADAVVASVERIIDPTNKSEQLAYLGTIVSAEKVDETTVRILTDGPDPILPSRMYWMKMIPPQHAQSGNLDEQPVGTGPYKFVDWQHGSEIRIEANEGYWGGAPEIDEVTYRFVTESGTRLSGLMSGEFDVITNLLPEYTSAVPKFAAVEGLETSVFILGADNALTSDPKVREALNLAIDRESMAKNLFGGYATVAKGQPVNPKAFGYNPDLQPYPYDPERAKALIAEAGATGKTLRVNGESGRWLKDREQIEAVAGYWAETGLEVDIVIEEFSQYLDSLMGDGPRPDSIFLANSNELLDADRESTFLLHMNGPAYSNSDTGLTEKLSKARTMIDEQERQALYHEVYEYVRGQNYLVPLFHLQDIYGLSERMEWTPRVDAKLLVSEMSVTE
ncbi:ABC transporter substrate-binding protein [Rhodobacteraceae bacterium F11138]|nr:ABC transporter substrate-binding protein [Rhodobacteraceae bacterium F11138]